MFYFFCFMVLVIILILLSNYSPLGLTDMIPFIKVKKPFRANISGVTPDYNEAKSWFTNDAGQMGEDEKLTDVFFVHRTTFLSSKSWNAAVGNQLQNLITCKFAVKVQTAVFKDIARVFAPKYRQATLYSFYDNGNDGKRALDVSYQDIKTAFIHYLKYHNNNRPFFLAGHSQGTFHLERLIKEVIDEDPALHTKLICAFLVAMPVKKNLFKNIHMSQNAADINCYVSWSTFGERAYPLYFKGEYDDALCTNPLTWENNSSSKVKQNMNGGSVTYYFNRKVKAAFTASVHRGVLQISALGPGFFRLRHKDYVVMDYHIFSENIKHSCIQRINNYRKKYNEV
jgi:Protein of unknown function (DUF3089)